MTPRPRDEDPFLDVALRALKQEESHVRVPARVETHVMAAWDRGSSSRVERARFALGWGRAVAVAAGVVLILTAALWQMRRESPPPGATAPTIESPTASSASHTPSSSEITPPEPPAVSDSPIEAVADRTERVAPRRRQSAMLVLLGEPIVAGEIVRVVRMRVPGATLAELGIRSISVPREQNVDLDVIVGEDGVARALRVGM